MTSESIHDFFYNLAFLSFVFLLPLGAEVGMKHYDLKYTEECQPGALVVSGHTAQAGLNRRCFREVRYRSTGLDVRLDLLNVDASMDQRKVSEVTGKMTVYSLPHREVALPGPAPSSNAVEMLSFRFRLQPGGLVQHSPLVGDTVAARKDNYDENANPFSASYVGIDDAEALRAYFSGRDSARLESLVPRSAVDLFFADMEAESEKLDFSTEEEAEAVKTDLLCFFEPLTDEDASAQRKLRQLTVNPGAQLEFNIEFSRKLPSENRLRFVYNRVPRSLSAAIQTFFH